MALRHFISLVRFRSVLTGPNGQAGAKWPRDTLQMATFQNYPRSIREPQSSTIKNYSRRKLRPTNFTQIVWQFWILKLRIWMFLFWCKSEPSIKTTLVISIIGIFRNSGSGFLTSGYISKKSIWTQDQDLKNQKKIRAQNFENPGSWKFPKIPKAKISISENPGEWDYFF